MIKIRFRPVGRVLVTGAAKLAALVASALLWFAALALGGAASIVAGIFLMAGLGWACIAGGVFMLLGAALVIKGMSAHG